MTEQQIVRQLALLTKLNPRMMWRIAEIVDTGRDAGFGSYAAKIRSRDLDGVAILMRGTNDLWEALAVDENRVHLKDTPIASAKSAVAAFDRLGRAYLETARALAYFADLEGATQ